MIRHAHIMFSVPPLLCGLLGPNDFLGDWVRGVLAVAFVWLTAGALSLRLGRGEREQ